MNTTTFGSDCRTLCQERRGTGAADRWTESAASVDIKFVPKIVMRSSAQLVRTVRRMNEVHDMRIRNFAMIADVKNAAGR
jgi:hypothetical protein